MTATELRHAAEEAARRSTAEQGKPLALSDPVAVARVAAALATTRHTTPNNDEGVPTKGAHATTSPSPNSIDQASEA